MKAILSLIVWLALILAPVVQANPLILLTGRASAAGGGPASASDDFEAYTNFQVLTASGNWADVVGTMLASSVVSGSRGAYAGADTVTAARWTATSFSADHESEVTIHNAGSADQYLGAAARVQSGSYTLYLVFWTTAGGGLLELDRINAGTPATIQSTAKSYVTGNKIKLRAVGAGSSTRLTVLEDTGSGYTAVWTSEDPGGTYIDGGAPGIWAYGSNQGVHMESWSAADYP